MIKITNLPFVFALLSPQAAAPREFFNFLLLLTETIHVRSPCEASMVTFAPGMFVNHLVNP